MPNALDHPPEQPGLQISIARRILRAGAVDFATLRDACDVILSLSNDPEDRRLATRTLRSLPRQDDEDTVHA